MKKNLSLQLLMAFIIPCLLLLTACDNGNKFTYNHNFTTGNNDIFGTSYGTVEDNVDGTICVKPNDSHQASYTNFGSKNSNISWKKNGLTASVTFEISDKIEVGEGFTWTFALNNKVQDSNGKFVHISERNLFFRKYEDGIKVGYISNLSSEEYNIAATSNTSARIIPNGWYTVSFNFFGDNNDVARVNIALSNSTGVVFEVKNENFIYGNNEVLDITSVGGLRYAWLSYMTSPSMNIKSISVTENR